MRPVLQYSKASSQNRLQVGTTVKLEVPPPNGVSTAGSDFRLDRSVKGVEMPSNAVEITKPGRPIQRLTMTTATVRSVHDKPLPSSSSGPSTPVSVKVEPMETTQVWALAGLIANNILSNEVNLDADSIFVKKEVFEEESMLPAAGFKRPKLELDNLVAEQLLDYKDGSYLVKWVGLPKEQSTWQAAQNLDCAQLVHQFHTSK